MCGSTTGLALGLALTIVAVPLHAEQGTGKAPIDDEIAELRRACPQKEARAQAALLGARGFTFLVKRANPEAMRLFQLAHGLDPSNAGFVYGLAIAHRRDGQSDAAKTLVERGPALERARPLRYEQWWYDSIEKFQGPDRRWLEECRRNAVRAARSTE